MTGEAPQRESASPEDDEPRDEPEEPEPPTEDHKAFMINGTLMARWAHDTRHMLVMEFIRDHHLFPELNAYLRKKIR